MKKTWTVEAKVLAWDPVRAEILAALQSIGLSASEVVSFLVAAEEMFVNIALYAFRDGSVSDGKKNVLVNLETGRLQEGVCEVALELVDTGEPFDPVLFSGKDTSARPQAIAMGGWGIHIARQKTDSLTYEYQDGANHLTLKKQIRIVGGYHGN